jgi:ribosomal protein S18 acetylase RimI-like enzyme
MRKKRLSRLPTTNTLRLVIVICRILTYLNFLILMQLKQLTKLSRLHKNDLRIIKNLVDHSLQQDGFKIKLYWNILQNRLTQELNDLFYFVDGNLAGYLALFTFEAEEAEISLIVHPKYRRQGIYKKLLAEALLELQQRRISKALCICPQGSFIDQSYLQAFKPGYVFSQTEMATTEIPVFQGLPEVTLRLVELADLPLIAKMGSISFQASFAETLQRFTENMQEKNRKIWLLSTPQHANVGKIHVRYDENQTAFIHDLCVLPEYRGKRYALAMVVKAMQMLRQQGQRFFTLDVECDNTNALRLYELCGYKKISTYDFWRVPLADGTRAL